MTDVPTKLLDVNALLKQARDAAYGEQQSQLVLAKIPIETEPVGEPTVTQAVQKRRLAKFQSDRIYQQLGTTASSINQLRSVCMNLARLVEQMPRGGNKRASTKIQEAEREERNRYEDVLKQATALYRDLKALGIKKAAEAKEMERQLTAARSDIYKAHRRTDETQADKQNRKGVPLEHPYPMHTAPNVLLTPAQLLIKVKKEIKAKEDTTSAQRVKALEEKQTT